MDTATTNLFLTALKSLPKPKGVCEKNEKDVKENRMKHRENLINNKGKMSDTFLPITPFKPALQGDSKLVKTATSKRIVENKMDAETYELSKKVNSKPSRLELLNRWRVQKKLLEEEERSRQKPVFKVHHVDKKTYEMDRLERTSKKSGIVPKKYNFAGRNHEFKPPVNAQPVPTNVRNTTKKLNDKEKQKKIVVKKLDFSLADGPAGNTRSHTKTADKQFKALTSKKNNQTRPLIRKTSSVKETTNKIKKKDKRTEDVPEAQEENDSVDGIDTLSETASTQKLDKATKESRKTPRKSKSSKSSITDVVETKKTPRRGPLRISSNTDVKEARKSAKKGSRQQSNANEDKRKIEAHRSLLVKQLAFDEHDDKDIVPLLVEKPKTSLNLSSSTVYPMSEGVLDSTAPDSDGDKQKTPISSTPNDNVYVSPFVTLSRDKSRARKEYKQRLSKGGVWDNESETTSIQAGSRYFFGLLKDEIARLEEKCNHWNECKDEGLPPEGADDMIMAAIGQSKLLIAKKMTKFRGLIERSLLPETDPPITCADLHGFWDLIDMEIKNVNKRFENLEMMKANNWEEILPEKLKVVVKKKVVTKKPVVKKTTRATSLIRDAIKAARERAKNLRSANNEKEFDDFFFNIRSHCKSIATPKSLLQAVVTSEAKRFIGTPPRIQSGPNFAIKNKRPNITSPGLQMMAATRNARRSMSATRPTSMSTGSTPVRSILKRNANSTAKKTRIVSFNDDSEDVSKVKVNLNETYDKENDFNEINAADIVEAKPNKRASRRLSRQKLFN